MRNRESLFWILHSAGWIAFAGAMTFFTYSDEWKKDPPLLLFLFSYVVGFLSCLLLRLFYKRIRIHERPLKFSVLIGVAAVFILANLWLGIEILVGIIVWRGQDAFQDFWKLYIAAISSRFVPVLGWTSLYFGIKIWGEWKEQGERASRANALAQAAQLQMLRYQINPHFLFNAMNSIRALIDENEDKAREMITELSEFLRYSLVSKDYADVPLREELEAIQYYFAIQKRRYEDKLEVSYDIDPQAGEYPVLSFLIHPLVENAIKYGMRTGPMPLIVHLAARLQDHSLVIEVHNTGKWVPPSPLGSPDGQGTGTGLDNVRRRLENAFPNRHRIAIFEKDGSVYVQLTIQGQGGG